jgi:hypothetical protein
MKMDPAVSGSPLSNWLPWVVATPLAFLLLALGCGPNKSEPPPDPAPPSSKEDVTAQVHQFCGACHAYPPPDNFPKWAWKSEVERGFVFFSESSLPLKAPPINDVIAYYESRAPDELPPAQFTRATKPYAVEFERIPLAGPPHADPPAVSNVNLVHLYDDKKLDLLACDMRRGLVMVMKPYEADPHWEILAHVPNPAHAEVVDLDGDGIKDILVANLGSFSPTDLRCGSVVWLRGNKDGSFTPFTLLKDVGRVADVQAAPFMGRKDERTGKDKLDLVAGVFGWQRTGEIYLLENQTEDWSKPNFVRHLLDERHGTIHVPVADLNNDGKPDFVALISQEHETVVAFINEGNGKFRKDTLFTGPHPTYGSSGIQLVDLKGDGRLDVLYTNGDVLDKPYLLKPYHSIQWLENKGFDDNGRLRPFEHHAITPMYGVHRAVAADFTGTGRKDIVAVCFLPSEGFPQRTEMNLDSIILLEQTSPGHFERHTLESKTCDHVTCAVGDIYDSGHIDFVVGNFVSSKIDHSVTIWKNLREKAKSP